MTGERQCKRHVNFGLDLRLAAARQDRWCRPEGEGTHLQEPV
jgi:hypothetical protein